MVKIHAFGFRAAAWLLLSAVAGWSQVIPAHPSGFKNRALGSDSADAGATVTPKEPPKVRHVTHLVLSEIRQWTSVDGRQVVGKLIAFEDVEAETAEGETPAEPVLPEHPTVVRDGKVRLLVKQKAVVIPLERLSEPDREFVEQVRKQLDQKEKASTE